SLDLSNAGTAPKYVRLVRSGDTISAYYGSFATGPWTFTESITIAMTATDYIGLVGVSSRQGTPGTSLFSHVSITTPSATVPSTPTLSFTANPTSVSSGSQSTLTWSTTNTTSCTASGGWSGTKATSGTSAVTPTQTSTFTLACTGTGGSVTKSVTVSVTTTPPTPETGGVLRVHPTNSRYFTDDSGKAIYMTGSHIWYTIQAGPEEFAPLNPSMSDAEFNAYLDWMQSHGQNFTRLWSAFSYMDYGGPFPWNRSGPGVANDGMPKFDMTSFNQQYFDLLRRRVLEIQDRGMYASVMFFGSYNGVRSDFSNVAWHPDNNINSELNSAFDPNDNYSFFTTNGAALDVERALVRKTIDTLNDVDNIIWETMNEPGGTAKAVAWNKAMVQYAHSYEATQPKQHLVGMTGGWSLGKAMLDSDADWISPDWDDEYKEGGSASYSSKIAIVDTDHLSPWYFLDVQEVTNMRKWVWKTFTRGNHPIFMDVYNIHNPELGAFGSIDHAFDPVRDAMGDTRDYSLRFPSLARMVPSETLSVTGYALYENGVAYLVYQPNHSSFTVNLSAGNYAAEWFDPRDASKSTATINHSGGSRSFTIPSHISNDAVLYLLAQ
ncbi:MAG: DUF6298 domain-containing protein, partial [Patescibacteria group bacterium]|nr:DUF6298 domain-containing protein [Patescibacteria group bacterium]